MQASFPVRVASLTGAGRGIGPRHSSAWRRVLKVVRRDIGATHPCGTDAGPAQQVVDEI